MDAYNMEDVNTAAKTFVNGKLYSLLYKDMDYANVSFNFLEKEAREYLINLLNSIDDISKEIKEKTLYAIEHVDYRFPVIEVSNYKEFFSLLFEYLLCSLLSKNHRHYILLH